MVITIYWPLVLFTVCASWAAGLFAAQAIWAWKANAPRSQAPAIIGSIFAVAVTALMASFASDNWKVLFGGEGNLTTGLDMVSIAIAFFLVVAVVFFIVLHKSKGNVARWLIILACIASVALLLAVSRFYSLAEGSTWDSPLWTLVILGNAAALGTGTMTVITMVKREINKEVNDSFAVPSALFNAVASLLFLAVLTVTGGARTQSTGGAFGGGEVVSATAGQGGDVITHAILPFDQELMFVSAVIVLGAVLAALAGFLAKKNNTWFVGSWLLGCCSLLGAFAINFVVYIVAVSGTMF